MDPAMPNSLIDLHHQKKQQKRQQQLQQQQFLYQQPSSGQFNDASSPPLPPLSHLMHNNNSNRHQVPMNVVSNLPKNAPMKQHLDVNKHGNSISSNNNSSKVSFTDMNSSPIPTQMYHHASIPQQQPLIQTKSNNEIDDDSLTFYQRSVVDIYQQPITSEDTSSFYSNINQDGNTQPNPSTTASITAAPSAATTTSQQPSVDEQQKIYSFVPLDVIFQQKRPRKKFNEVERLYACTYLNCTKAYGTLNHLNAHVTMQGHGPKRMPIEFKELRRQLKKNRKKLHPPKSRKGSNASQKQQGQQQGQQREQQGQDELQAETNILVNKADNILQQHPPPNFLIGTNMRENHENNGLLLNNHHQQQEFNLYGPPPTRSASISSTSSTYPQQQQPQPFQSYSSSTTSSSLATRYPPYNMMQQQQQFH